MKKYILLIAITISILSCEKPSNRPVTETPLYLGTYVSSIGDTLYVTEGTGIYTQFQLSPNHEPNNRILFDSVKVNTDNTFTDNEQVYLWGNYSSIGTGNFGTNTIYFNFNIGGGTLIYNGVK
jgi:hypothetical protein